MICLLDFVERFKDKELETDCEMVAGLKRQLQVAGALDGFLPAQDFCLPISGQGEPSCSFPLWLPALEKVKGFGLLSNLWRNS